MRVTGSEILNRTSPTLLDLGVALAAGGAAAFAQTRRGIASSIAGVAVAVALVPPLAVSGIGLALGRTATTQDGVSLNTSGLLSGGTEIAAGAFILFLTNLIGIVTVAILTFVSQRYGEWKKALLTLIVFVSFSFLLVPPLNQALHELYVKNRVIRLIAKLSESRPDLVSGKGKIRSIDVTYRNDLLHIYIRGFSPAELMPTAQDRVDQFREILSVDIGEPVVLELEMLPIEFVHIRSEPEELRKAVTDPKDESN